MDTYKINFFKKDRHALSAGQEDHDEDDLDERRNTAEGESEEEDERESEEGDERESEEEDEGENKGESKRGREEEEGSGDEDDAGDDVNFLRRVGDDEIDDVFMREGSDDSGDDVYFKPESISKFNNGISNGKTKQEEIVTAKTPVKKTNGVIEREWNKECNQDEDFKEFTPTSKKRRVDPATPSTPTTSNNSKNNIINTNMRPTPSKFSIGTPTISRQKTPSKNSPFVAYKPIVASIGILESDFNLSSPSTPKRNSVTPKKTSHPLTPFHHKTLSEQLESSRTTAAVGVSRSTFPFDFVLKNQAVFTSYNSFEWCKKVDPQMQLRAMAHVFSSDSSSSSTTGDLSDSSKYFAAASYFKFPGTGFPFEGDVGELVHKQIIKSNWIRDRWKEWEESFSNLYHSFAASNTAYFYLIHHSFSVLFSSFSRNNNNNINNNNKPSTIRGTIGKSTRGLRVMLYKAGIPFSMPYYHGDVDYLTPMEDSEAMLELKEMQHSLPWQNTPNTTKGAPVIPLASSMLVVEGKKEVEKLFKFLLGYQTKLEEVEEKREKERLEKSTPNKKNIKLLGGKSKPEPVLAPTRKMLRDVPVLYANTPFLNATFKQITMKSNDTVTRSTTKAKLETAFKLELDGPILPHNLQALCEIFAVTQKGNFNVTVKHDETTDGMNWGMGQGMTSTRVKRAVYGEEGKGSPFMLYMENM